LLTKELQKRNEIIMLMGGKIIKPVQGRSLQDDSAIRSATVPALSKTLTAEQQTGALPN